MIRAFILCIGRTFRVCAQAVYQDPNLESRAVSSSEKAFLADFTEQFKADLDTTNQYTKARTTPIDGSEMALFVARKEQTAFYRAAAPGDLFSAPFWNYIEACIRQNYWMLDDFEELNVNDEAALLAEPYRNFLAHYVAFFSAKERRFVPYQTANLPGRLADGAGFARQHLPGKPVQYILARLLITHCTEARPSVVRDWAGALGATPGSGESGVPGWLGELVRTMPGGVSILQTTPRTTGKKQKNGVVFLYISIDDTEAVWKNALNTLRTGLVGRRVEIEGNSAVRYPGNSTVWVD